jgi:hypothetical protein
MMKSVTDRPDVPSFQKQNVPARDLLSFLPEKPSSVKVTMYRIQTAVGSGHVKSVAFCQRLGERQLRLLFQSHNGICLEIRKTGKSKFQLAMTFGL